MVINSSSTKLFAGVGLAVPRLGNVRLRLHFLRRGTSMCFNLQVFKIQTYSTFLPNINFLTMPILRQGKK
jgi:hypothetical protein